MNIGYACLALGVPNADFRSCILRNASDEKLVELIAHNLNALENIIDYNIRNQIKLFRISSGLIPFASAEVNRLPWWDLFETQFSVIGEKLNASKIRVSMHPGQYTILNSPDGDVVERSISDLSYHAKVLDALHTDSGSKLVMHIGGVYGDKKQGIQRFINQYQRLDQSIKRRLVIENDDRSYTIADALDLSQKLGIPVIFDTLHHRINPCSAINRERTDEDELQMDFCDPFWIREAGKTWRKEDGRQKIHYSQQALGKRPGSHSATISTDQFLEFYHKIKTLDVDLMLEVKDKNLSAVKCRNLISDKKEVKALEQEWSKYKYAVLERSPRSYQEIRALLREKSKDPAAAFYRMLEDTMTVKPQKGSAVNAAEHIWGYFRESATDEEKKK
ncbi:MAG: UV DNA damage repair endonuclease UvsE [Eubacteriales bacterium]|nr:UV DNA damage repair endonuclease UvsE [Eubacteriales bacterium]